MKKPKGNRVKLSWSKRPVELVAEGPEQSVVRFLDTGVSETVLTKDIIK